MTMDKIKEICDPHIQRINQASAQIRERSKELLMNSQRCEEMVNEAIISNGRAIGRMTEEIWDESIPKYQD